jgi:hypothetical protein
VRFAPSRRALGLALGLLMLVPAGAGAFTFSKAIWGPVTRNGVDQFPLYHQLGVGIYEADLRWNAVAPKRPRSATDPHDRAYRWPPELDQAISEARSFQMRVMLQIVYAPRWANGGHADGAWAPRNPADFAAFATAAARRYPKVHLWMIWGEPTRTGSFKPLDTGLPGIALDARQRRAPHLYARVLDGAYGALKRVSHENLVIGGCTYTTGAIDTLQWIRNLRLPSGKPPRMDMYGHNPFSYQDPTFGTGYSPFDETQFNDLPRLAQWTDRYLRRGLPLFLSEWTIPTHQGDGEFNFYVDPPVAARWITSALAESRSWHRIYALGWVNIYDDPPRTYGGLLTKTGAAKPSFAAFQNG